MFKNSFQLFVESMSSPEELADWMKNNIAYGWLDGDQPAIDESRFLDHYRLQTPEETFLAGVGVCSDQVELQRVVFDHLGLKFDTIYCVDDISHSSRPAHVGLIYREGRSWNWFENAFEDRRGIHRGYASITSVAADIKSAMISRGTFSYSLFSRPEYGMSCREYVRHCESSVVELL